MRRVSMVFTLCASLCWFACAQQAARPQREPVTQYESAKAAIMPTTEAATHVLNRDEPWFEHPAQARPPNGQLAKKTRVRVLQDAGSYSKVQTAEGTVCFVATDALSPL